MDNLSGLPGAGETDGGLQDIRHTEDSINNLGKSFIMAELLDIFLAVAEMYCRTPFDTLTERGSAVQNHTTLKNVK